MKNSSTKGAEKGNGILGWEVYSLLEFEMLWGS
jgi:hypothetical protein